MDLQEKLLAFTATALGVATTDVEAKLEDAEDATPILDLHKAKVREQKEKNFNDGFKKAERKVLTDREKEIKEEFGIESDKIGLDLIRELLEAQTKSTDLEDTDTDKEGKKKPLSWKDIPIEVLKKHPEFIKMEDDKVKAVEANNKKWQSEVEAVKAEYAAKEISETVGKRALVEFRKLKPLLSLDPEKAARQEKDFIAKVVANNKFELVGEETLILDDSGNKKEDPHGNTLKFNEFIRNTAELYHDFQVAEERSSPGATTSNTAPGQKKYTGKQPTSLEEKNRLIMDTSIPLEARNEIQKDWEEKHTSNV